MIRYELSAMLSKFQFNELAFQSIMEPNKGEDKVEVLTLTGYLLVDLGLGGIRNTLYNYDAKKN